MRKRYKKLSTSLGVLSDMRRRTLASVDIDPNAGSIHTIIKSTTLGSWHVKTMPPLRALQARLNTPTGLFLIGGGVFTHQPREGTGRGVILSEWSVGPDFLATGPPSALAPSGLSEEPAKF